MKFNISIHENLSFTRPNLKPMTPKSVLPKIVWSVGGFSPGSDGEHWLRDPGNGLLQPRQKQWHQGTQEAGRRDQALKLIAKDEEWN